MTEPSDVFQCRFCDLASISVKDHVVHTTDHKNLSKQIQCGFRRKCKSVLPSAQAFSVHVIRNHKYSSRSSTESVLSDVTSSLINSNAQFQCPVDSCCKVFFQKRFLMTHLKIHFTSGLKVPCTHSECLSRFSTLSSFTGHLSKSHTLRNSNSVVSAESMVTVDVPGCNDMSQEVEPNDLSCHAAAAFEVTPEQKSEVLSKDKYLVSAQFYLKLTYKHLVPESTTQVVAEELKYLLFENNKIFLNDLKAVLHKCEIPSDVTQDIIDCMYPESNILNVSHTLRSTHMRKKAFRKFFDFVEPQSIDLGEGFFYYVPSAETLKAAFRNKSWNLNLTSPEPCKDGVLRDFTDGRSYLHNDFFKENPAALRIILYQDGFELVCPIGPAHNLKHKVLGVYMAIGNLPPDVRFQKENIQLLALCLENEFDHKIVYGKIVDDFLKVQRDGVDIPNAGLVKAGLAFVAGDNLGSHCLAGLIKSFSCSLYFCRYCMLQRSLFVKDGGEVKMFKRRTPQLYASSCQRLGNQTAKRLKNHKGVKYDSEFNQIRGFHVCSYGLPACLGHDLCAGVIAHDLKLFIQYFIRQGWFTLDDLNSIIDKFPYSTEDKRDRPCIIKKLEKPRLAGGAWQLWSFLRLFPLIVQDFVPDFNDSVWKCMLLLRELTLIIVAPEIHLSHLPHLKFLVEEYLVMRRELFPGVPLRPKHHYLMHYPELILFLGSLMKLWTMRFESKHTFFYKGVEK